MNEAAAEVKLTKYDKPRVQKKKAAPKQELAMDNGDAVMSFNDKPKAKKKKAKGGGPPDSFLKRQQVMQDKAQDKFEEMKAELKGEAPPPKQAKDVEMLEEEKKPAASKAPSRAPPAEKARPKTAKPAGKKPKIQVDDSGPGVAKEDAENILNEKAPAGILKQFEESKWQDKKEAYTKLAAWISEEEYSNELFEASFWFIKIKMKEWKEKNVNIVKAALQCISDVIKATECMSKRAATIIIPFLSESIGDAKYKDTCHENLLSLSELVGPGFVAKNMCKHTSNAKAPNIIIENNACLAKIIDEFGTDGMPVQEMINIGIICCDHKNVKVRNETINMLSTLYKHLGESIRTFLKDIKDSTLAVINAEFDKITPLAKGQFQSKREIRNEEVKQEVEEAAGEDPLDCIPRQDVSKDFGGQKLISLINDDNWKKRKEAVDKMNAALEKANMRILPNGLSEVVGLLKVKMADSNKSVSKGFLEIVGKLAIALGPTAKQYAPMLIKPLFRCLSEKNTLYRNINLDSIDKWAQAIGAENLIGDMGKVIVKENPEIRSVLLDWILKNKDSISKSDVSELPKPLVSCLQDKAPAIRSMAEKVIIEVIPLTGAAPFKKLVKDLKPAVQNSVKPLVDNCIAQASTDDQEMEDVSAPAQKAAPVKTLPPALSRAKDPKNASIKGRPKTAAPLTAKKIHEKLNKKPLGVGGKAAKASEDTSLQILDVGRKDKRNEADKKKRWHPEEIRDDYVEKLKIQSKTIFGEPFANKMFSADFKNCQKCLKTFSTVFENDDLVESFCEVLDVVIKWAYIKSNEISNIAFLKDLYFYFDQLIDFLIERDYVFMEAEGTVFCLCLVEKIGMNNATLKEKIKEIIMKVGNSTIFFPKKLMSILIKGFASKNTKTVAECLECVAGLIQTHQLEVINEKDVRSIAKQCESPDNGVRQSALIA